MKSLLMVFLIIWVSSSSSMHSSRNGFSQALRNQNPSHTQGPTPNAKLHPRSNTQCQATPKVQHPMPSHTQCQTTPKVQTDTQCQATPNVQHPMPSYTKCPTPNAKLHQMSDTQCQATPKIQHPMPSYTQCPTPYVLAANQA